MNERSSRSHSVFTLYIRGVNVGIDGCPGTEERCEGSLSPVVLEESERINLSFANVAGMERVRVNKSLSAPGGITGTLGEKGEKGVVSLLMYSYPCSCGSLFRNIYTLHSPPISARHRPR